GKLGPLICYEVVFPGLAQEAARAGARALVTMTNDGWFGWTSGPRQHLVHGQLRAAENGLPLLRAANTGISVIVDRHGRNLGEIGLGESGFLVREVELGDVAGNRVAVLRGLSPGERVITMGAAMVLDGDVVEVMPTEVP
ncbi:MAG: hypothetical protein HC882_01075, partial [Acidobacteria bacterium]|nr:hypothetical protein [Acidobacteriota bacterium]